MFTIERRNAFFCCLFVVLFYLINSSFLCTNTTAKNSLMLFFLFVLTTNCSAIAINFSSSAEVWIGFLFIKVLFLCDFNETKFQCQNVRPTCLADEERLNLLFHLFGYNCWLLSQICVFSVLFCSQFLSFYSLLWEEILVFHSFFSPKILHHWCSLTYLCMCIP